MLHVFLYKSSELNQTRLIYTSEYLIVLRLWLRLILLSAAGIFKSQSENHDEFNQIVFSNNSAGYSP